MNISGISFTSTGAQLAALLVESEAQSAERTNESLDAVQQRIARQADEEYEERMAAADASARSAFIGGAFAIAGGAASAWAGYENSKALDKANLSGSPSEALAAAQLAQQQHSNAKYLTPAGQTLSALAPFAAEYGGKVEAERREARAQRIGRHIEQASVEAEQLSQQAQRQEQRSSAAVEAARGFVEAESARSSAVASNF
jgi:hypothetical protein